MVVGLAAETTGRTRTEVGSAPAPTATVVLEVEVEVEVEVEEGAFTETTEVMATAGALVDVLVARSVVDVVMASTVVEVVDSPKAEDDVLLVVTAALVVEVASAEGTEIDVEGAVAAGGTSKVEVCKAAGIETVVTPTPPLARGSPSLAGAPATTPGT